MFAWHLQPSGIKLTGLSGVCALVIEENSPTDQPEIAIYNRETGDYIEAVDYQGAKGEPYCICNVEVLRTAHSRPGCRQQLSQPVL